MRTAGAVTNIRAALRLLQTSGQLRAVTNIRAASGCNKT